jgi:hypothetical protein
MAGSQARLAALKLERKPLVDQSEFYAGKPLPRKLKSALDANDASVGAQNDLLHKGQLELADINANYDQQRDHLKRLWPTASTESNGVITGTAWSPSHK